MDLNGTVAQNDDGITDITIPLVTKIIYVIWLVMCLIPNAIIIKKLSIFELYQSNYYYIIVHWSWCNILQMIYSIYVTFVPQDLVSDHLSFFSIYFYMVTPLPAQLAFYFTIDKFVNSKTFCRENTRMSYKSLGFAIILLSILAYYDVAHTFTLAAGFIGIHGLTIVAFIIRLVIYCFRGSEEDTACLRILMATVCIVINALYIVYVVLVVIIEYNIHEIYFYVTMAVHLNGMVNLALLHFCDPSIDVQEMVSDKLENFKKKFRKKTDSSEQESSQTMSPFEHSV